MGTLFEGDLIEGEGVINLEGAKFQHFFYQNLIFYIFLVPGYKPEGPIDTGLSVRQLVSQSVSQSVTARSQ